MNYEQSVRDKIITEWFFHDWIGDTSHLPEPEDVFIFMKLLLDILSVDGTVSEFERNYVIGRAAIFGSPQNILDQLQTYQPNPSENAVKLSLPHARKTRMGLIYNLFRIFGADNKIHPKALKGIRTVAKQLDVPEDYIQQLQNLYEDEEKLRQKRASLLFPQGFNDALMEYQKLH